MRRLLCITLCICCVLVMAGCSKQLNMNTVLDEPNFAGIVTEVSENAILVKVNEDEDAYKSSDFISVSLDVEIPDGLSEYHVGDEVRVYYDGKIAETYPAQITKVYAITIVNEFKGEGNSFQNGVAVHEDQSVQIIRSMMELDYTSITVSDFNAAIQAICVEADTNVFDVISNVYDYYAVYDNEGTFVATVFTDRDLESFVATTLAYSAQEIFGEPVHLSSIARMTMPGMTAQELYQSKEQMPLVEWNRFFEEHISEISIYPVLSYSIDAITTNPDTLLVSDRDDRINNVHAAITAYILGMDEEAAAADNFSDMIEAGLDEISREYSDTSMAISCSIQSLEQDIGGMQTMIAE